MVFCGDINKKSYVIDRLIEGEGEEDGDGLWTKLERLGVCEKRQGGGGGKKKKKVSGHNSCWRKDHWRVRWVLH